MRVTGRKERKRVLFTARKEPPLSYSQVKASFAIVVERHARAANLPYLARFWPWPVAIGWWWFEATRHRDIDGVSSGARKIVLDGLVDAGVLPTDTPAHVARFRGEEFYYGTGVEGLSIAFADAATDRILATLVIPVRFPDLNELLAMRESSARRAERLAPRG